MAGTKYYGLQKWGRLRCSPVIWDLFENLRLIVPWRCALLLLSTVRWGDKRERGGGRQGKGGKRQSEGHANKKMQSYIWYCPHRDIHSPTGKGEAKENIDHWWVSPVLTLIRKSMRAHQWYLSVKSAHSGRKKHSGDMKSGCNKLLISLLLNLNYFSIYQLTNYSMKFIK